MVTIMDIIEEKTVHDLVELLLREPNQNKPLGQFFDELMYKLECNVDENQMRLM